MARIFSDLSSRGPDHYYYLHCHEFLSFLHSLEESSNILKVVDMSKRRKLEQAFTHPSALHSPWPHPPRDTISQVCIYIGR